MEKDFARVLQKIELFWGEREALTYFDSLLLDNREGRQGFPDDVLSEITLLKQVHDFLFPSLEINPNDPFSSPAITDPSRIFVARKTDGDGASLSIEPVANPAVAPAHAPADTAKTQTPGNWHKICAQHDMIEIMELRHNGKNIYAMQGKPVGEILVHYGFIDERKLLIVRRMQDREEHRDKPIGQILVDIGIVDPEDLACALYVQAGVALVNILEIPIPSSTIKLIPYDKAREKQIMPICVHDNTLFLAVADPFSFKDKSFFTVLTNYKIELAYAPRHEIVNRLNLHGISRDTREARDEFRNITHEAFDAMQDIQDFEPSPFEISISENDSTIINLVNKMILSAISEGASDIHIEWFQGNEEADIRFRRDGRMEPFSSFPRSYHPAVVSRIKIMASLDISERRRPQDGKISFPLPGGNRIDLRVSTIPALRGTEFVTIRLLASGEPLPLSALGMSKHDMDKFRETFHHTYGLILVCGPTGSGKTTTLHSVIKELNTSDRKIWTVEDPVEIVQPHLCQVQVNNKANVTFANVLRALLRADPDIIMIGEMRDQETAKIALEASMTGHLVLSTLHTNSAPETVARLLNMGIDPFNLSDALLAILAQRLARKLCGECTKPEEASALELEELANEYYQSAHDKYPARAEREAIISGWRETYGKEGSLYLNRPVGCNSCNSGYKGRIGLYELLRITHPIRHLIGCQSHAAEYKAAGIADGMKTLKQDGIEKVLSGITDIEQVHSACA